MAKKKNKQSLGQYAMTNSPNKVDAKKYADKAKKAAKEKQQQAKSSGGSSYKSSSGSQYSYAQNNKGGASKTARNYSNDYVRERQNTTASNRVKESYNSSRNSRIADTYKGTKADKTSDTRNNLTTTASNKVKEYSEKEALDRLNTKYGERGAYGDKWDKDISKTVKGALKETAAGYGKALTTHTTNEYDQEKKRIEKSYEEGKLTDKELSDALGYLERSSLGQHYKDWENSDWQKGVNKANDYLNKLEDSASKDIEEAQDGHSRLGKAALSALHSGTGMAVDAGVGLLTGGAGNLTSMGIRSYGNSLGEASGEGATDEQDIRNALLQAGLEVGTEKMFGGIGLAKQYGKGFISNGLDTIMDKAVKKYGSKMGSVLGTAGRGLMGILEENAEETVSWLLSPVVSNMTYADSLQKKREDEARGIVRKGVSDIDLANMSEGDIQTAISRLNSDDYLADSIASYKEQGLSDADAKRFAEANRDYVSAILSGDDEEKSKIEDKLVDMIAGGENSVRKGWSMSELADTILSTTILTGATGAAQVGTSSVASADKGARLRAELGSGGIKDLVDSAVKSEDKAVSERAKTIKANIEDGSEISNIQIAELSDEVVKIEEADKKRQATYLSIGTEAVGGIENTPVKGADGKLVMATETGQNYNNAQRLAIQSTVVENAKELGLSEDQIESLKSEDSELSKVISAIANIKSGIANREDVNLFTEENETARAIFAEVTGETLPTVMSEHNKKVVDQGKTNAETKDRIYSIAAQSMVDVAGFEYRQSVQENAGAVDSVRVNGMGSAGQEAYTEVADSFDAASGISYRDYSSVADAYYMAAKSGNFDSFEDFQKSAGQNPAYRMMPIEDRRKMFEAGLRDSENNTDAEGTAVMAGESFSEGKRDPETGTLKVGKGVKLTKDEISIFRTLASRLGVKINIVDGINGVDGKTVNGYYVNGEITLNVNAKKPLTWVFMHEFTHHLFGVSESSAKRLTDLVQARYSEKNGSEAWDEALSKKMELYKGAYQDATEDELKSAALEEIIADAAPEMLRDEDFVNNICENDVSLARDILNAIRDTLRKIRYLFARAGGFTESDDLLESLDITKEFERIWVEAMHEAAKNRGALAGDGTTMYSMSSGGGYHGRSMSNRAVRAYAEGEMPLSKWGKADILDAVEEFADDNDIDLTSIDLSKLTLAELKDTFLVRSSWHHTGALYNATDFYKLSEFTVMNLTQKDIDDIIGRRKIKHKSEEEKRAERINRQALEEARTVYGKLNALSETKAIDMKTGVKGIAKRWMNGKVDMEKMREKAIQNTIEKYDALTKQWAHLPDGHYKKDLAEEYRRDPRAYAESVVSGIEKDVPTSNGVLQDIKKKILKEYEAEEKTRREQMDTLADAGMEVLDGGTVRYSLNSLNESKRNGTLDKAIDLLKNMKDEDGNTLYDSDAVDSWLKDIDNIARHIAEDRDRLDYSADPGQPALKKNSEYIYTLDFSTLCPKRLEFQGTYNAIMRELVDIVLTPDDVIDIRNIMNERGYTTPCGFCYEESRKKNEGIFAERWLNGYGRWQGYKNQKHEDDYIPTLYEVTTTEGRKKLRVEHPEAYDSYVTYQRTRGSANPKISFTRTDYKNEILDISEADIEEIKRIGGLRLQSFSDFEIFHVIDIMQAVLDMSAKGLTAQAYTKVAEFADILGNTGIKINLSLVGQWDSEKGEFVFDGKEGMDSKVAFALREKYPENVGTILVGADDLSIEKAMQDDRIDMIIPFHRSGWSKAEYEQLGTGTKYKDYTKTQTERKMRGEKTFALSKEKKAVRDAAKLRFYSDMDARLKTIQGTKNNGWMEDAKSKDELIHADELIEKGVLVPDERGKITVWSNYQKKILGAYYARTEELAREYADGQEVYSFELEPHEIVWRNDDVGQFTKLTSEEDAEAKSAAENVRALYSRDYWDYSLSGPENAKRYLEECAKRKFRPVFPEFLDSEGEGENTVYKLKEGCENYWKLLIDFKMYDNDGKGAPQIQVKPNINMEAARKALANFEGGEDLPVHEDVVREFVDKKRGLVPAGAKLMLEPSEDEVLDATLDMMDGEDYNPIDMPTADRFLEEARQNRATMRDNLRAEAERIANRSEIKLTHGKELNVKALRKRFIELDKMLLSNSETSKKYKSEHIELMSSAASKVFTLCKEGKAQEAADLTMDVMADIVDGLTVVDDVTYEQYKSMLNYFKGMRIYVPESQRSDMDYEDFRRKNMWWIKLTTDKNNASHVDEIWNEIREASGYRLPEEDAFSGEADMLLAVEKLVDSLKEYTHAYESPEAFELIGEAGCDFLDMVINDGEEWNSFADKKKAEYDAKVKMLKARHKEALREVKQKEKDKAKEREDKLEKKLNERYKKKLKDTRKKYRKMAAFNRKYLKEEAHRKEKEDKRKYMKRIQDVYDWLSERLEFPTDDKHIPQYYREALAEMLEILDLQTLRSKKIEKKKGKASKKTLDMRRLREVLRRISEEDNSIYSWMDSEDNELLASIDDLIERFGNDVIVDALSNEDLEGLSKALLGIKHMIATSVYLYGNKRKESALKMGMDDIGDKGKFTKRIEKRGIHGTRTGILGMLDGLINQTMVTPIDMFTQIGGSMLKLYNDIRKGHDQHVRNIQKIQAEVFDDLKKAFNSDEKLLNLAKPGSKLEKWRDSSEAKAITLESGKTIKMTPAQIMSLYALSKREAARAHLVQGGIVLKEVDNLGGTIKDKAKEAIGLTTIASESVTSLLTNSDIINICSQMTAEQQEVADKILGFMNTVCKDWGNSVSIDLFGYEKFTEDNYFPMRSAPDYLAKDPANKESLYSLLNMSFTKALTKKANNPLIIDDFFTTALDHINKMSMYNSFAIPVANFLKVYNLRYKDEDGKRHSYKATLRDAYGTRVIEYVENFIKDLNGSVESRPDGLQRIYNKLLSNYKRAAVAGNIRVGLQQPTALFRAFQFVDAKYLKGTNPFSKDAFKRMVEHCPIAAWKAMGNYDINLTRDLEDVLMNQDWSIGETLTMGGYGFADNKTWCTIFQMVENETRDKRKDLEVGSSEYWEVVNDRASEIFDKTQVVDSVFHRSQGMRSKDLLMKSVTSFKAEPTRSFNMLRSEFIRALDMAQDGNKKEAGKIMSKITFTLASTAAVTACMTALVDAIIRGKGDGDDDENQTKFELFLEAFRSGFIDTANPLAQIYGIGDVISMMQGWDVKVMSVEGVAQTIKGMTEIKKVVTGESKKTMLEAFRKFAEGMGYLTGHPVKNILRDTEGIFNAFGIDLSAFADTGEVETETADTKSEESETETKRGIMSYDRSPIRKAFNIQDGSFVDNMLNKIGWNLTEEEYQEREFQKSLKDVEASAKGLSGEEKNEAVWKAASAGYTKTVGAGNVAEADKILRLVTEAGGDVDAAEEKISKKLASAYMKTIGESEKAENQAQIRNYLQSELGYSDQDISSICYKSETAKKLKAACRIYDKDMAVEALTPLIEAGLTREDFHKIYVNRNRGDVSKYIQLGSTGEFICPTTGTITSKFGYRDAPTAGASSYHEGIDIGAAQGTPVQAADGGVVKYASYYGGYGNQVVIMHDDGTETYYSHLYSYSVKSGDKVAKGQQIGEVGSTGVSTGPHLDFRIKKNGNFLDPETIMKS